MVDIMSERFVRQLEELHVELITMGSLCEKAISLSAKAIQGEGGDRKSLHEASSS